MSGEFYNLKDAQRFPMGPLEIDIPSLYQRFPILKDKNNRPGYVPLIFIMRQLSFKSVPMFSQSFCLLKTTLN